MTKVVSSREVQFTSETPYNVASILANLVDNNPNCFIFGYEKGWTHLCGCIARDSSSPSR